MFLNGVEHVLGIQYVDYLRELSKIIQKMNPLGNGSTDLGPISSADVFLMAQSSANIATHVFLSVNLDKICEASPAKDDVEALTNSNLAMKAMIESALQLTGDGNQVKERNPMAVSNDNVTRYTQIQNCPHCNLSFNSTVLLSKHIPNVPDAALNTCEICMKPMKNKATLSKHRKLHYNESDLQYICTVCNKRFLKPQHLSSHCKYKKHMLNGGTAE